MHWLMIIGLVSAALGTLALLVPTITFFTNKQVADTGFFSISVSRPHTIVFNPIVGIVGLTAGIALILLSLITGA